MNVGSLFSGIGGFDLGFERAGMRTSWFCEQDDYCTRVLNRHWPGTPVYPDVTKLTAGQVEPVDLLCGGFPCQDISTAGRGAGIRGERSGLWSEFARLIGELEPRWVVVENVSALLGRGLSVVCADLSALGYDAEWDCIPASAVGAPHQRDRIWIVAYPRSEGRRENTGGAYGDEASDAGWGEEDDHVVVGVGAERVQAGGRFPDVADAESIRGGTPGSAVDEPQGTERTSRGRQRGRDVADPDEKRRDGRSGELGTGRGHEPADSGSGEFQDPDSSTLQSWRVGGRVAQAGGPEWWAVEPPICRVAHGVPNRLDQLAALGNALVPQIAEWIGRQIMSYEFSASPVRDGENGE